MNEELTKNLAPGHSTCAGCAIPTIIRTVLGEADGPVVVANATSCSEVTTTLYPYTAWKVPYIHNAFENAAATISGVERAHKALLRKKNAGNANLRSIQEDTKFVVFAGDGGTYDIGLQSLSGALERGHNFLYVVYDNGGYMNTGNQRSSATPYGAATETTPAGKESFGKMEIRKNLMEIVKAHGMAYLAQTNVAYLTDLKKKAKKALETEGPTFLSVFSPCTNNWKFPTSDYVKISKLATETNFWPLYEISAKGGSASGGENYKYAITYEPISPKPVSEFLKTQGRFKHLFSEKNKPVLDRIQGMVNEEFARIAKLAEE